MWGGGLIFENYEKIEGGDVIEMSEFNSVSH